MIITQSNKLMNVFLIDYRAHKQCMTIRVLSTPPVMSDEARSPAKMCVVLLADCQAINSSGTEL